MLFRSASQYGANTLTTTHAVEDALATLAPALRAQGITLYGGLHRPANFIERALQNLEHSLGVAAFLIVVVLYAFLRNARAALIAFVAIPSYPTPVNTIPRHYTIAIHETTSLGYLALRFGRKPIRLFYGRTSALGRAASGTPRTART